jgi:hypothetical protein
MATDSVATHSTSRSEIPPADDRRDDPSRSGDPSNPLGRFWHPEDRDRGEAFLRMPIEETNGSHQPRAESEPGSR